MISDYDLKVIETLTNTLDVLDKGANFYKEMEDALPECALLLGDELRKLNRNKTIEIGFDNAVLESRKEINDNMRKYLNNLTCKIKDVQPFNNEKILNIIDLIYKEIEKEN